MVHLMFDHLFKDEAGRWKEKSFTIDFEAFRIKYYREPFLKEIAFIIGDEEICCIDYYGEKPSYSIGSEKSERINQTKERIFDFLATQHPAIAKWMLWNMK